MIARRNTLAQALDELEAGALAGASAIVVSRHSWEALSANERDAYRSRAERLGQLYDGKGEWKKAAEYYSLFVELWKEADPDLQPDVAEAQRRLAALSRGRSERNRSQRRGVTAMIRRSHRFSRHATAVR